MVMEKKKKELSPLRAIREKCIDCCCGDEKEVELCPCEKCSLYTYRLGKDPKRAGIGNKKGYTNTPRYKVEK